MQLSEHFSLEELCFSQNRNISNVPSSAIIEELRRLAKFLEDVRMVMVDHPIIITSGYRSPALNASLGGVKTSQHMKGQAADFICPKFGNAYEICALLENEELDYDQLINEHVNVHISIPAIGVEPRLEALTRLPNGKYEAGIHL